MKTQEQRSEKTRARILNAAEECFAQVGFDATGVAEICERAGVSKGAFYHHFATKQELFLESLNRWLAGIDAQLATLRDDASSVPDGLLAMTGLAQDVLRVGDRRLPIYLEYWSRASRDPVVWQATIEPYRRYRQFFARVIEAGIAEGTLREVDPDAIATVFVSLAVGLLLQGLLDPQGADWGDVWRQGMSALLDGLVKK